MKTRAAVLHGVHQDWKIEEVDLDEPGPGEIIAVAAYLQGNGGKVTVTYPGSAPILKDQIAKAGRK